jgi:hemerythrin superfamily protein
MIDTVLENDHDELHAILQEVKASFKLRDPVLTYQLLDRFWARLAMHIRAENVSLFPALENAGASRDVISQLKADHNFFMETLGSAMKSKQPQDMFAAVHAIEQRLEQHNLTEEREVYGWPKQLLSDSEQQRVEAEVRRHLANLPPRFL